MKFLYISLFLFSSLSYGETFLDKNLKKMNWNGIEVTWLKDSSLPTYDVSFYFSEGALGDNKKFLGETNLMFNQLTAGTKRYFHKDIVESLEFYGTSYGSHVTHEFSSFGVGGLIKDFSPSMKMICHLFSNATFPKKELKQEQTRIVSGKKSIITNHSSLASQIFRYESLVGTGYEFPVTGTIESIKNITAKELHKRLEHFNLKVQKRIYIKGPKEILAMKDIILNDCGWKSADLVYPQPIVKKYPAHKVVFIPVPEANQAQVRVGRTLTKDEVKDNTSVLKNLTETFLGGGFTSRLVQKLRVERGLTYSAGAYASEQNSYGRSGINTFTKNETIIELLAGIKEVLQENSTKISKNLFERSRRSLKGDYLFSLESTSDFLERLETFDHRGQNYDEIYKASSKLNKLSVDDLKNMINNMFAWSKQTVVIVGNKKLIKVLRKNGYKVEVKSYKTYL